MRLFRSIEDNTNKKKKAEPVTKQKHNYDFLVVDDSKFSRSILTDILKAEGYNIVGEAGDGLEAIEQAKAKKPSFIFMDITMPKMDGLTAAKEIIQENPDINIIMCSALSQKKIIVEAIKAGAKDFVIKPYKKENILSVVDLHMEADKKGQVIPFRSDNHLKKGKKNVDFAAPQVDDERDLSLDEMISKEIDIIFESYQDEKNKIELVEEPILEVVKETDEETMDEASLTIESDNSNKIDALDVLEDETESLNKADTDIELSDITYTDTQAESSEETVLIDELLSDDEKTVNLETETTELRDEIVDGSIAVEDTDDTVDQFNQFLDSFGSRDDEVVLISLEADEDEAQIDEEEPTLAIYDDEVSHAMYSLDNLSSDSIDETESQASDTLQESSFAADNTIESAKDEKQLDDELLAQEVSQETNIGIKSLENIDTIVEHESLVTDKANEETIIKDAEDAFSQDSIVASDSIYTEEFKIPEPSINIATEAESATVTNAYTKRFTDQAQNINTKRRGSMKVSRIGASQLLSKPAETELDLGYNIDILYNMLSAYICLDNRFSNKNMQFKLKSHVKSRKRVFASSLNKGKCSKSISMLNVYRKDIYKKETTEEQIDEGLMIAVTNLVKSKGTRILGNNKFNI